MVWLAVVESRCPVESHSGKDRYFLGEEAEGTRRFWRIQREASDPGLKRASLGGDSVVSRVARHPGYFDTRAIYASELFQPILYPAVLGPERLSAQQCDGLIDMVLRRLDLIEIADEDATLLLASERQIPGLAAGTRTSLQRWLACFVRKRNLDHILLLCLLYQRSVARGALEEAIMFRDAVVVAIQRFCQRPGFNGDIQTLWLFMTKRRVFMGQASLDHSAAALAGAEQMLPGIFMKVPALRRSLAWHRWLMAGLLELQEEASWTRIMPRTVAWEEFVREREDLREQMRRDSRARSEHAIRRFLRQPEHLRVGAATRLAEMRGHREPWRPSDY